ncbi:hypothetical protein [Streptococcus equi]|uniref:hypothetical protein n=1 Tax=Streptococcus equi TaxID=1336 RepID=UPI001E5EADEF|nr:hypothetical protein [Streptococcus equi]
MARQRLLGNHWAGAADSWSGTLHGQPYSVKALDLRFYLFSQDALRSVNPLFTIQEILTEALSKTLP